MLRYLTTALLLSVCSAWVPIQKGMQLKQSRSALFMNPDGETNPCWQDIYDADCTMDSVFSARFVASDWIKELPCGSGMKDCDFPEDVLLPDMRPESHTEINVMEFLNIKRPEDSKKLSP